MRVEVVRMADNPEQEVFDSAPDNWGRWGDDDQKGAVNYLTNEAVLEGVQTVSDGNVFTLGTPIGDDEGEPLWPERADAQHFMNIDHGHYASGKADGVGTRESADDLIHMYLHGATHFDALGHVWYDGKLYNEFDQTTTMGGLQYCDIHPIADHGVVGRAVLLDVARHRGVDHLDASARITLGELRECAAEQETEIRDRSILLVRSGWIERFYADDEDFYQDPYREPGITYSDELVEWFDEKQIAAYCTDTVASEQTISDTTGTPHPLHPIFLRDLGIPLNELCLLDDLAADCADDGRYDMLYVGAPLKVRRASGAPANPVAIK
jgi:kynurenine formamidase